MFLSSMPIGLVVFFSILYFFKGKGTYTKHRDILALQRFAINISTKSKLVDHCIFVHF
jgi:hypothetical protein